MGTTCGSWRPGHRCSRGSRQCSRPPNQRTPGLSHLFQSSIRSTAAAAPHLAPGRLTRTARLPCPCTRPPPASSDSGCFSLAHPPHCHSHPDAPLPAALPCLPRPPVPFSVPILIPSSPLCASFPSGANCAASPSIAACISFRHFLPALCILCSQASAICAHAYSPLCRSRASPTNHPVFTPSSPAPSIHG